MTMLDKLRKGKRNHISGPFLQGKLHDIGVGFVEGGFTIGQIKLPQAQELGIKTQL
jgi:hypothetical protein